MKIDKTIIEGVYIINNFNVHDDRGLFVKTFNNNGFKSNDINFEIRESYYSVKLSAENKKSIFIPKGLAHGFKSLKNNTVTVYNVATEYNNDADYGILYNSFDFDWEITNPIISTRDKSFVNLNNFKSPF